MATSFLQGSTAAAKNDVFSAKVAGWFARPRPERPQLFFVGCRVSWASSWSFLSAPAWSKSTPNFFARSGRSLATMASSISVYVFLNLLKRGCGLLPFTRQLKILPAESFRWSRASKMSWYWRGAMPTNGSNTTNPGTGFCASCRSSCDWPPVAPQSVRPSGVERRREIRAAIRGRRAGHRLSTALKSPVRHVWRQLSATATARPMGPPRGQAPRLACGTT